MQKKPLDKRKNILVEIARWQLTNPGSGVRIRLSEVAPSDNRRGLKLMRSARKGLGGATPGERSSLSPLAFLGRAPMDDVVCTGKSEARHHALGWVLARLNRPVGLALRAGKGFGSSAPVDRRSTSTPMPWLRDAGRRVFPTGLALLRPSTVHQTAENQDPMPKKQTPIVLPEWLPAELWAEFLTHRKILKKPMTDYAQSLAFKVLERVRAAGHDPRDSIEQSILNGWQGLFEPRAVEIKSAAQTDYQRTQDRDHAEIKRAEAISKDELRTNALQARERVLQIKRERIAH